MEPKLFVKICKVDEAKQEVHGYLAEEAVDKSGEIFDYATSKPYFQKWNEQFTKATSGESVGNLREMHGKSAVGKFTEMTYDDLQKKVFVIAKVVDAAAWQKVMQKVYTGFSIGAKLVAAWTDPITQALKWTANPVEGSLVDNPCMYGCTFTAVKMDGTEVQEKFPGKLEDPEKKKSMYHVSALAEHVGMLGGLHASMQREADREGDGSPIPGRLKDIIGQLSNVLVDAAREESSELISGDSEYMDKETVAKVMETLSRLDESAKTQAATSALQTKALEALVEMVVAPPAAAPPPVATTTAVAAPSEDRFKAIETGLGQLTQLFTTFLTGTVKAKSEPSTYATTFSVVDKVIHTGASNANVEKRLASGAGAEPDLKTKFAEIDANPSFSPVRKYQEKANLQIKEIHRTGGIPYQFSPAARLESGARRVA